MPIDGETDAGHVGSIYISIQYREKDLNIEQGINFYS